MKTVELDAYRQIWTHVRMICALCLYDARVVRRCVCVDPWPPVEECPECHAMAFFVTEPGICSEKPVQTSGPNGLVHDTR